MGFRGGGHDEPPFSGGRTQDAVVADLVNPGRRDQGGELLEEFQWFEDDMGGPVAPAMLETVEQPLLDEIASSRVPRFTQYPLSVPRIQLILPMHLCTPARGGCAPIP